MGGGTDEVFYNFNPQETGGNEKPKVTKLKVKIETPGNYGLGYIDGDISKDKPTIIDWGNGTVTTLTTPITDYGQADTSTDYYTNYSESGEYEISIDGWYNHFRCYDNSTRKNDVTQINEVLIEIVQVSSFTTNFYGTFSICSNLKSIPDGLFDKNTKVTDFSHTFSGCSGLTSIPSGLFNNNTSVTDFTSTFNGCSSLTSIPSGLFDKNTSVTSFYSTFLGCSSLTSIPTGLFDNNTSVTSFSSTFAGCSSLTSIPTGLFDKNTSVTDFSNTFYYCSKLTGETPYTLSSDGATKIKLWDRDGTNGFAKPTSTGYAFYNCYGLTDYANIPSDWK